VGLTTAGTVGVGDGVASSASLSDVSSIVTLSDVSVEEIGCHLVREVARCVVEGGRSPPMGGRISESCPMLSTSSAAGATACSTTSRAGVSMTPPTVATPANPAAPT
jgi:hypothetical protein